MKLIDVSVALDQHLPNYPGNAPLELEPVKRLARGDSSNVSTIRMSAHAGTHVDAPRHFFDDAGGIEALPLDLLCGRARVVHVAATAAITADDLRQVDRRRGGSPGHGRDPGRRGCPPVPQRGVRG